MKRYIFQIVILVVIGCGSSHVGSPTSDRIKVSFVNESQASKSSDLKSLSISKVRELVQNEMTGDEIFVYQVAAIPNFSREFHGEIVTISDNVLYVYNFRNETVKLRCKIEYAGKGSNFAVAIEPSESERIDMAKKFMTNIQEIVDSNLNIDSELSSVINSKCKSYLEEEITGATQYYFIWNGKSSKVENIDGDVFGKYYKCNETMNMLHNTISISRQICPKEPHFL